ncbi:MAG: FimV/HubP family polar landmark protein [Pseudomonadota bacterium]
MREIGLCGLLLILAAGQAHAGTGAVAVGRYSVVAPVPRADQSDPLETIVRLTFPPYVKDVGGAVDYLLVRSGYRLADAMAAGEAQLILLRRPLPESQRTLGPISLRRALETLGGEAFWLVEDPVHRLVAFEVADDYRAFLQRPPASVQGATIEGVSVVPLVEPVEPPIETLAAPPERADPPPTAPGSPASYGPIGRGDSLGSITQVLVPDAAYTLGQRMLAVFEHNPQAFGLLAGAPNMNLLRVGAVLTAPDAARIGHVGREEARLEADRQYQAWQKAVVEGAVK